MARGRDWKALETEGLPDRSGFKKPNRKTNVHYVDYYFVELSRVQTSSSRPGQAHDHRQLPEKGSRMSSRALRWSPSDRAELRHRLRPAAGLAPANPTSNSRSGGTTRPAALRGRPGCAPSVRHRLCTSRPDVSTPEVTHGAPFVSARIFLTASIVDIRLSLHAEMCAPCDVIVSQCDWLHGSGVFSPTIFRA